jgi:hypothetical protein
LGRREFVGDRPARFATDHTHSSLQAKLVDLDHEAIDLVVERLTVLLESLYVLHQRIEVLETLDQRVRAKAQLLHPLQHFPLGYRRLTVHPTELVKEDIQRSRSGDGRIELSQRAGGRVARAGKQRQTARGAFLVEALEALPGHVDLATHLETFRRILAV